MDVPEFDVHRGPDGALRAVHRSTGREIEASSYQELSLRACAIRILTAWRRAAGEPDLTTGDLH